MPAGSGGSKPLGRLARNNGEIGGIYLKGGSLTMVDQSSIRGHRTLPSSAAVLINVTDELPASFTMKEQDKVNEFRKEGKNPRGGLNAKGRASYNRAHGGNLKAPAPNPRTKKDASRRKSFCARMGGMKKRLTSAKTARDPDSRINKALRKWNC